MAVATPRSSGGRSARFTLFRQPAARPAIRKDASTPTLSKVITEWTRAVRLWPKLWITAKTRMARVAMTCAVSRLTAGCRPNGASRYDDEANAAAAIGAAKPIMNETQPERNATGGPYASYR